MNLNYFQRICGVIFYWKEYFDNNNVTNIIGVHTCYSLGY